LQAAVSIKSLTITEYLIKFLLTKYYHGVFRKSTGEHQMKVLAKEKVKDWINYWDKRYELRNALVIAILLGNL
jgi:hypothetical protein